MLYIKKILLNRDKRSVFEKIICTADARQIAKI